jgi:hypothetical protein
MTATLHVLSLGSLESCNSVRDALLPRHNCQLSSVTHFWDLYAIPKEESIDIAILHQTLSLQEARNAGEYIHHQWPHAEILLIHPEAGIESDHLYDGWALPDLSPTILRAIIEELTPMHGER